jgi:hypothetical protein
MPPRKRPGLIPVLWITQLDHSIHNAYRTKGEAQRSAKELRQIGIDPFVVGPYRLEKRIVPRLIGTLETLGTMAMQAAAHLMVLVCMEVE